MKTVAPRSLCDSFAAGLRAGLAVTLAAVLCSPANGQVSDCKEFLNKPVFTQSSTTVNTTNKEAFRLLQCSANWKSAQEVQSAGIETTVPIYDIPVPFNLNWSQQRVDQWKSKNCTQSERQADASLAYYRSVYSVDPITATTALACFEAGFKAQGASPKALSCNLTETAGSLLFEASWRRSFGEADNPPQILTFSTVNTTCKGVEQSLAPKMRVPEGGVAVLCTVQKEAAAFSLNTNRGSCTAAGVVRASAQTLSGTIDLAAPRFMAGDDLVIAAGTKIVTNGYPLDLRFNKMRIEGPASIVSFNPKAMGEGEPGSPAGPINITVKDITGTGLSILNAGQPGGKGATGTQGPEGPQGSAGKSRASVSGCGVFQPFCNAAPICTGGQDGGTGGQGNVGYQGLRGAPGGSAGRVTINAPVHTHAGFLVLTDVNVAGQPQSCDGKICGGLGGGGGDGGPGGIGGRGGPGAPGTVWCGGTSEGPRGPGGPQGPPGDNGPRGAHADVRMF